MAARPRVLFVDDDERLLSAARRVLRRDLDLHTAIGAPSALALLENDHQFDVLVSDQNMPGMKGTAFLSQVYDKWPLITRIMLTGNNDQHTAASAVNDGNIFRFLSKPCSPEQLLVAIKDGVRHHKLISAERDLLERTLSGSVKVLMDVLALSDPNAFRKGQIVRRWAAVLAKGLKLKRAWDLDMAAMLWPLGDITLPPELIAKRDANDGLSDEETALIAQTPAVARDLIGNIPRMQAIADTVYYCRAGYDGSGFPGDGKNSDTLPYHARILRVLIDLAQAHFCNPDGGLTTAFENLGAHAAAYDPDILSAAKSHLLDIESKNAPDNYITRELTCALLLEGDQVIEDIKATNGRLLLASGGELSLPMIQKLRQFSRLQSVCEPIYVRRLDNQP